MIKKIFLILTLLISTSSLAVDTSSGCGLKDSTDDVEPFSTTICPQDKTIESLFNLFPDLTIRGVEAFNLDYGNEIVEKYSKFTVLSKERALQSVSYYITQISIIVIACVISFGAFNFIYEFAKGKNNKKGESINVPNTIFLSLVGLALLMKINGFYGYQWLVLCAGFISVGLTNALISTVSFYLQATMSNGGDPEIGGGASLLPYSYEITNKEIATSLCTIQLLINEEGRDKAWLATPLLGSLSPSQDQDKVNSPVEVLALDADKLIVSYGTGTASTGYWGSFMDWIKDRNPVLCGKETIDLGGHLIKTDTGIGFIAKDEGSSELSNDLLRQESVEVFSDIVEDVTSLKEDGFAELPSLFALWVNNDKSDELSFSNPEEKELLTQLSKIYHKAALFVIRNSLEFQGRRDNYYKELYLGQQIRKLTCIENLSTMYKMTDLTLKGVGGNKKEYGCATKLRFELEHSTASYNNPSSSLKATILSSPIMFFEEMNDEELQGLRLQTLANIEELRTEILMHNQNTYGMLLNSYIVSQSMQRNTTVDEEVLKMRQEGLAAFSVNFMSLAQAASVYKRAFGDIPELVPNFVVESLNEYFLPLSIDDDEIFVSKISNVAFGDDNAPENQKLGSRSLLNDVYKLSNVQGNSAERNQLEQRIARHSEGALNGTLDSLKTLLAHMGLGVDSEMFDGSGFLSYATSEGWSDNDLQTNFLIACYSGKTANFSEKMIIQCEALVKHPLVSLRTFGENLTITGLSIIGLSLAGAMAIDQISEIQVVDHGELKKKSILGRSVDKGKSVMKNTAKTLKTISGYFDGVSNRLVILGGILFILGVLFACFVPLIPVISFGVMYFYWIFLIAIGVIAGSVFIPMYFKSRVQGAEVDNMDSALTRLLLQITLKPLVMIAALIMVWMLLDLSLKFGTLALSSFWADTTYSEGGALFVAILMVCMILASSYIFVRLAMFCYKQLHEISSTVMDYINLGGHSTYRTVTDYAGMIMLRTVGDASKLKKSSEVATWIPKKAGDSARLKLQGRRGRGEQSDASDIADDAVPDQAKPDATDAKKAGSEVTKK